MTLVRLKNSVNKGCLDYIEHVKALLKPPNNNSLGEIEICFLCMMNMFFVTRDSVLNGLSPAISLADKNELCLGGASVRQGTKTTLRDYLYTNKIIKIYKFSFIFVFRVWSGFFLKLILIGRIYTKKEYFFLKVNNIPENEKNYWAVFFVLKKCVAH